MDKYSNMPPEEPKFPQAKKPVVKDLNAAKVNLINNNVLL